MKNYKLTFLLKIVMLMLSPFGLRAQTHVVYFEQSLSLQQAKEKAKAQNKYLFVDCYASWCGPCKQMDAQVYTNDTVANFINAHFVSLKARLDTAGEDAKYITRTFQVKAFPTSLFFNPDGTPVHEEVGFQTPAEFVKTAQVAMDPARQYYTLLAQYRLGHKDYPRMRALIREANAVGDGALALALASDYVHNYLDQLNEAEFLTPVNLNYISHFPQVITSHDRLFRLCLHEPAKVDTALHFEGWAKHFVNVIITQEDITPKLNALTKNQAPNWDKMEQVINKKYRIVKATTNVLTAKVKWYAEKKNNAVYVKAVILLMNHLEKSDPPVGRNAAALYNSAAWDVFEFSKNKTYSVKALAWSNKSLALSKASSPSDVANYEDTRANLEYRLGHQTTAIETENEALKIYPKSNDIPGNLQSMLAGKPIVPSANTLNYNVAYQLN